MAILIKMTDQNKIKISGTDIEIKEVYGRIRFLAGFNGKTIEGEVSTFANKEMFNDGKILHTNVPMGTYQSELKEGEQQSIEVAHKYAKLAYEQQGYKVDILL